jgi:hypothetical protein
MYTTETAYSKENIMTKEERDCSLLTQRDPRYIQLHEEFVERWSVFDII